MPMMNGQRAYNFSKNKCDQVSISSDCIIRLGQWFLLKNLWFEKSTWSSYTLNQFLTLCCTKHYLFCRINKWNPKSWLIQHARARNLKELSKDVFFPHFLLSQCVKMIRSTKLRLSSVELFGHRFYYMRITYIRFFSLSSLFSSFQIVFYSWCFQHNICVYVRSKCPCLSLMQCIYL